MAGGGGDRRGFSARSGRQPDSPQAAGEAKSLLGASFSPESPSLPSPPGPTGPGRLRAPTAAGVEEGDGRCCLPVPLSRLLPAPQFQRWVGKDAERGEE